MFQNWGFLLGEIWVLLLIAALLGLFCGWLIWGGRNKNRGHVETLEANNTRHAAEEDVEVNVEVASDGDLNSRGSVAAPVAATVAVEEPLPIADELIEEPTAEIETDIEVEAEPEIGIRPTALEGPRGGVGDDLKQIKGIGPKLEQTLHGMGVYHFDQIASWGDAELAWVDSNLEGFYGRASRDEWIAQAKQLAN